MDNEKGNVLLSVLLILMLVTVFGIIAINNTDLETQIAANDRIHKETFYQADAGTQLAIRLVEESLGTQGGFTQITNNVLNNSNATIFISDSTLSENENTARNETSVSDTARDVAYFPGGYNTGLTVSANNLNPHTNIIADGATSTLAGAGLQMVAGYEGKGKGTAGGGGQIRYNIYSQHMGRGQSESVVQVRWRHVIGLELEGRY